MKNRKISNWRNLHIDIFPDLDKRLNKKYWLFVSALFLIIWIEALQTNLRPPSFGRKVWDTVLTEAPRRILQYEFRNYIRLLFLCSYLKCFYMDLIVHKIAIFRLFSSNKHSNLLKVNFTSMWHCNLYFLVWFVGFRYHLNMRRYKEMI